MKPNEMTPGPKSKVITAKTKEAQATKAVSNREAYRRLMANEDFKLFYNYLERCYNDYIENAGDPNLNRHSREFLSIQANAWHKTLEYIKRQTN